MNKLTIALSGKKQSGKNATCNYIVAKRLNRRVTEYYWDINEKGILRSTHDFHGVQLHEKIDYEPGDEFKIYSFADPLKQFCINVFGATWEQMYGTDAQKNSMIEHILWDNIPDIWRPVTKVYHAPRYLEFSGQQGEGFYEDVRKSGPMTGRELMQLFGTEIVRKIYGDAWARATYSAVANDGAELALICDGRFPNEVEMGNTVKAKSIRLLRAVYEDNHASETALDNYPHDRFTLVVDNRDMTLEEQCKFLDPYIDSWFEEAGIQ
jgi:hypothetical protein